MTADPMTDKDAAEAFTKKHQYSGRRSWNRNAGAEPIIRYGNPKNVGKPQCQGECADRSNSMITDWSQCTNVGKTVLADGSTWCGIHGPAGVGKRAEAARARYQAYEDKWKAQADARKKATLQANAHEPMLSALRQIADGHNDPRGLATETLKAVGFDQ